MYRREQILGIRNAFHQDVSQVLGDLNGVCRRKGFSWARALVFILVFINTKLTIMTVEGKLIMHAQKWHRLRPLWERYHEVWSHLEHCRLQNRNFSRTFTINSHKSRTYKAIEVMKDYSWIRHSHRRYCYPLFIVMQVKCKQINPAVTIALFHYSLRGSKTLIHAGHIKSFLMLCITEFRPPHVSVFCLSLEC
jgi:hypothetical protein